ncbi:MAG: hypothetical protein M3P44_12840 [Actinomycetota bacterium]|nr:hypothetical protein [Actinomycetota bacterium]
MHRTHARARSLIDGILEYARSGTSLATEPVDTGVLMADVAASLTNAIDQLHGELEIADQTLRAANHMRRARHMR